jgi:hypothetical protein
LTRAPPVVAAAFFRVAAALSVVFLLVGLKALNWTPLPVAAKQAEKTKGKKNKRVFLFQRAMIIAAHLLSSFFISRSPLGCEQYQQANYILHIFQHYQLLLLLLQQQTHQSLILPPPFVFLFLFLFLFSPNNAANQCYERANESQE